jgi:FG-GAP-like repeat
MKVLIVILCFEATLNIFAQFDISKPWAIEQGIGLDPSNTWVGDFNGDGMDDKLQFSDNGDWWVALSNGISFNNDSKWAENQDGDATKYYIGDFNGDSMDDILSYRSTGGIWKISLSQQSLIDGHYTFAFPVQVASNKFISTKQSWVGDFNGDGIDEILFYSAGLSLFKTRGFWDIESGWGPDFAFTFCYTGDFNGDGYDDFSIYRKTDAVNGNNSWLVAASIPDQNKFDFESIKKWVDGQGLNSDGHFICDLNGDGKADKLNYYSSSDEWWAAFSGGNNFSTPEELWAKGLGEGINGAYIGDFNGDNLSDLLTYNSNNGRWLVGLNIQPQQKIIAIWFTAWYKEGNNFYSNKRDPDKTPVVGFRNTTTSLYNSTDPFIINKQIDAMIDVGINLLIVDITNGWNSDSTVIYTTDSLFAIMSRRPAIKRIKIAIGLGKEFWGPREFKAADWKWVGWEQQSQIQETILNEIYERYAGQEIYDEIYFNYLSRPLIIAYLASGLDYQDENGNVIPIAHNKFTIKKAVGWASTYFRNASIKYDGIFLNGQDSKRFWGWGAKYPQPYNLEQMSILPGTYIWWNSDGELIPREGGNFYINSWKRILETNPNFILIADWNNWNEETSIEGCEGINGWKDLNGYSTYDWYLKITKTYINILKENNLPTNTYLKQDGLVPLYKWTGDRFMQFPPTYKPYKTPIIELPEYWLQTHNYTPGL